MAPIPSKASAEQARNAVSFSGVDWSRFIVFTREEARRLLLMHPERTWAAVPANEKYGVRDRVNDALVKEGIRKVGDDLIGWRMAIAVRDLKQSTTKILARTAPSAAVAAVSEPATSRSFDPIRDI